MHKLINSRSYGLADGKWRLLIQAARQEAVKVPPFSKMDLATLWV